MRGGGGGGGGGGGDALLLFVLRQHLHTDRAKDKTEITGNTKNTWRSHLALKTHEAVDADIPHQHEEQGVVFLVVHGRRVPASHHLPL